MRFYCILIKYIKFLSLFNFITGMATGMPARAMLYRMRLAPKEEA